MHDQILLVSSGSSLDALKLSISVLIFILVSEAQVQHSGKFPGESTTCADVTGMVQMALVGSL